MSALISPAVALTVETFRAQNDGCLAYLVVDEASHTALAIDPRLDQVDRLLAVLTARDVRLVHALDTHTHADHLSGVRRLAQRTGATVLAHAASKLKSPARRVRGGETFEVGTRTIEVLDAAGHTPDSLALRVDGHLFTGDALFAGGAGRTDFMGGSASALYDTFRAFEALPDDTVVHPGHDYVGRRLYLLHNPITGRTNGTTPSFFATMTIRPAGIVDRPHRHSSAAINYFFQGRGRSTVEGRIVEWSAGDLMLSAPGWAVHNHASYDERVYELTVQDQPFGIATESLLWQEDLKHPPAVLGAEAGFATNRKGGDGPA